MEMPSLQRRAEPAPKRDLQLSLMPTAPDYESIGEFYSILKDGLCAYSRAAAPMPSAARPNYS
jgi:hypothetical protein